MKITNNGGEFLIRYEPTSTIFSKDETKALDFTEQEVYRIFKEPSLTRPIYLVCLDQFDSNFKQETKNATRKENLSIMLF